MKNKVCSLLLNNPSPVNYAGGKHSIHLKCINYYNRGAPVMLCERREIEIPESQRFGEILRGSKIEL